MTDDEINIAIAEAMGIKPKTECPECYGTGYGGSEMDHIPCIRCNRTGIVEPYYDSPDYTKDLNAMREAEEWLFPNQVCQLNQTDCFAEYRARLELRCLGHPGGAMRATARQRAETFCQATGIWKD